jgi:NAD(P)-dependent dehydrogenase (short-subunit alcohol dehydrogenase family)
MTDVASYYRGKHAVITGGSSGLGRAFALELAHHGAARILIADLDETRGASVVQELQQAGVEAHFRRCDVADREQIEALGQEARSVLGRLDFAFNNAGVASGGDFFDIPPEDWDWLLSINLMAVVNGCRTFGLIMREQGGGHLINTASLAAFGAAPGMTLYNVAKAGVLMLSETLRAELAPLHIRVSAICPGFVHTNLMERTRVASPQYQGLTRMMLEGNKITPERIARAALQQIAQNKLYIFPTWDARAISYVKRFFPNTMINLTAKLRPLAESRIQKIAAKRGFSN